VQKAIDFRNQFSLENKKEVISNSEIRFVPGVIVTTVIQNLDLFGFSEDT
jgi:hypothetical protein